MKEQHAALLEQQRHELRAQLDSGRLDVPALVVSMRSTLSQLEASLAQSHEECCRLFADVSMLKTEKALVSRELHDTERRAEALQRDTQRQSEEQERRAAQLAERLAHAQSRADRLADQLARAEGQARLERTAQTHELQRVQEENIGLREQIDNLFGILAKKDETAYKLCSKLLTLKEARDQKDTEALETMAKYQRVIGKVLDQLNDVNMENLLLVSNRLQHNQPQQYKMLLESLKFKIYLETENAGMTQEANRLRYENSYLKQANRQLTEELQDVRLRLLPQELREERVELRDGRLTRARRASHTQTEPEKRAPSPTADSPVPADFPTPETSSQSSVSLSSLPESQQRAPPPVAVQAGGRPRRQRRRDTAGGRRRVVTWGQLLEAEPEDAAADRLDTAAVTQMIQLAAAQSTELEQLGHSVELSDED
ncbi:centrosomal protein of 83 kDa-like [Amphibalanus amphitrite]|uniref:centrosomal protein of 83 kDa-like n=1 Tax=Amphibalanus amphitrite TaxID=1232801 RepID=UPI001C904365|nr:centrosomal protein of 83 kDa-like [Amphibalanus amphitrite]